MLVPVIWIVRTGIALCGVPILRASVGNNGNAQICAKRTAPEKSASNCGNTRLMTMPTSKIVKTTNPIPHRSGRLTGKTPIPKENDGTGDIPGSIQPRLIEFEDFCGTCP